MMVLYIFKFGSAFKNDECSRLFSGYVLPVDNQILKKWHARIGIQSLFWWIVASLEFFFDIATMKELFLRLNYLEAGYFVGKMAINGTFYAIGSFISFVYQYRRAKMEAEV